MAGTSADRRRMMFFAALIVGWQLIVLGKVFYIKVFQHDYYLELSRRQKEDIISVPAPRGKILDCRLETLAASIPFESVGVYLPHVQDRDRTARLLAETLHLEEAQVRAKLDSDLKFRFIKRFAPQPEAQALQQLKLRGVGTVQEYRRIYPNGDLAAHLLGAVTFQDKSENGLEGLEKQFNQVLCGEPGEVFLERDGRTKVITTKVLEPVKPGHTLVLNLDSRIQYVVQRELAAGLEKYRARTGMAVVMDPVDGRILALAVCPGFEPGNLKAGEMEKMRNLAVERYFEPGSTFKIVTASGALAEGLASPDEVINCGNGFITISGHIIRDHRPFQNLTFTGVLAESSDVGAIKLGMRLGEESLYHYIRAFGFGERTGIDLPAEEDGFIRQPSSWSAISIGAISMGQEIGVTAIQMTRAMAVFANGGFLVRPRVVDRVLDERGKLVKSMPPVKSQILDARTTAILRESLVQVVEQGTGKKAGVAGYQVAGKTGTAQKYDQETRCYSPTDFVASFCGFAPAREPAFVINVIYDSPHPLYHGGDVSAPVFREIARQLLLIKKIPPEQQLQDPRLAAAEMPAYPPPAQPVMPPQADSLLVPESGPRETVITLIPEDSFKMPDFTGRSLRTVMKECGSLRLILQPSGSGLAVEQIPPPGALIKPETRCSVWFSTAAKLPVPGTDSRRFAGSEVLAKLSPAPEEPVSRGLKPAPR